MAMITWQSTEKTGCFLLPARPAMCPWHHGLGSPACSPPVLRSHCGRHREIPQVGQGCRALIPRSHCDLDGNPPQVNLVAHVQSMSHGWVQPCIQKRHVCGQASARPMPTIDARQISSYLSQLSHNSCKLVPFSSNIQNLCFMTIVKLWHV